MSYNFAICDNVREQILALKLTADQEEVLIRCVGGYSNSKGWGDSLMKSQYQWTQWWNNAPDWNTSIQLLDKRKVKTIQDNGNGSSVAVNVMMAPLAGLDYLLQESGRDRVYKLIKENNGNP